MKKHILAIAVLTLIGGNAMAHVASTNGTGASNTPSPYHSATPTVASGTSAIYKVAIVAGQQAAVDVLNGAEASDLFVDAKGAAEAMLETSFENDVDAARVIITLAEQFNKME